MVKATMNVEPNQQIPITIGAGGAAGSGGYAGYYGGEATTKYFGFNPSDSYLGTYGVGASGGYGGQGGASEATIFGNNLIVFPSSVVNNRGKGGNPGQACYCIKVTNGCEDPYSGSFTCNIGYLGGGGGSGGNSPTNKVLCTETHSTSLNDVQVITPTATIGASGASSGQAGNGGTTVGSCSNTTKLGGSGGYGGASASCSLAAGDDSRLRPASGGRGGSGGKGGDLDCDSQGIITPKAGNAGYSGSNGSKGRDGYIKISWGYD